MSARTDHPAVRGASGPRRRVQPGERVWVIREDGSHEPATFERYSLLGFAVVRQDGETFVWDRVNLIDHETGERLL